MTNILGPDGLAGCFRCAYVWHPRSAGPNLCPRCKSRQWDVPKLRPVQPGRGLGVVDIIAPKRDDLYVVLQSNSARNPRVFGAVARSEATFWTPIDLLVDFDPGASAFHYAGLVQDLESVFKRRVDVAEPDGLHWLVRPQVLFEAVAV